MSDQQSEDKPEEVATAPVLVLAALVIAMCLSALAHAPPDRAGPPLPPATVAAPPAAAALRDGRPIDLNAATQAELELLPRVGPAIAERIIKARPFENVDDLVRVSGVGPRTLERLRSLVSAQIAVPSP